MSSVVSPETDFQDFPKMARLTRDVFITEKIDGTNAQVFVGEDLSVRAGSRTRYITPDDDNHGFAKWVHDHTEELRTLGPGRHFGEWWGLGIQRKYGLAEKRFSMFNVGRWALHGTEPQQIINADPRVVKFQDVLPPCCGLVPVLFKGRFCTANADEALSRLEHYGSFAAPGFMNPEGIVVFHVAAGIGFKKTLGNDGSKGASA